MTSKEQELEIEVRRLQDEVARLERMLAKVYSVVSVGFVHRPQGVDRPGRPLGSTKFDETGFARRLVDIYATLPVEARSKEDVARAMKISRRTLHRYLERWSILWPPAETEAVLARLRAEQPNRERQLA